MRTRSSLCSTVSRGTSAAPKPAPTSPAPCRCRRAEGHVDGDAALRQLVLRERGRAAGTVADQRQVAQVGEAGALQLRELVIRRHEQHVGSASSSSDSKGPSTSAAASRRRGRARRARPGAAAPRPMGTPSAAAPRSATRPGSGASRRGGRVRRRSERCRSGACRRGCCKAATSACAACRRATITSAWRSRRVPASVSETARGPPGRSSSRSPTIRSSVWICWLIADCV